MRSKTNGNFLCMFLVGFQQMVFVDGFPILVKELGLFTDLGQWIRGFGCHRILYMYFIINKEDTINIRLEVQL
jgi:hypothetical protein